jgi:4-aminobutyrate aminotransferase
VRESCARHGALLIFDEIPSCLARTGALFACENFDVAPDILVIGKGLGGGIMPMAAIVARADLDCAPQAALGHYTHEKSPLGCAAAIAALRVVAEDNLVQRARDLGAAGLARLEALRARHAAVGDVRGFGCYFGVEIGGPRAAANQRAERLMYACLQRGLSFKIGGGNVITLCPPLTIPLDQFHAAFDILDEAFDVVSG